MPDAIRAFALSSSQEDYLQEWLQRVSRSFALVVPLVESPLQHYLATAYLLCRVIDNIEDCTQPTAWKQGRFGEAGRALDHPEVARDVLTQWQTRHWPGLTADETRLMGAEDGLTLWQIYGAIPAADRAIIQRWVHAMIDGMAALDDAARPPRFVERKGVQVLESAADYNEYCYIVAGTVGHLSSELVVRHYGITDESAAQLRATCEACGRGLQKTNIVKDFAEDLRRGVSYLPASWLAEVQYAPLELHGAPPVWAQRVLNDVLDELAEATTYLLTLPINAQGYRMASLLCLLPAYQTLLAAAQTAPTLFTAEHHVKISREVMERCLTDTAAMWADNDAIAAYTADLRASLDYHFVLA